MANKLIEYIENSFLKELISNPNITDITYNGEAVFYMNNKTGRQKAKFEIGKKDVMDFIRQIANLAEKQFSFTDPNLDVSIGRYRINATHSSIVRVYDDKSISFAIRIASKENRIKNDKEFMPKHVNDYLQSILDNHESLVISGSTGSGKTELQKYLIGMIEKNAHIIVIDNIQELESVRSNSDIDLTSWQVLPSMSERTFENLIRNALRNNPDWLIIAEARGKEMADILLSTMSGHPIITTIHAKSIEEIPGRMTRMIQTSSTNQQYNEIFSDLTHAINNYVYLERSIDEDGVVKRYIKKVGKYNVNTNKLDIIYERK